MHLEDFIIRYSDFRPKKEKAPSESIKPLLHLSLDKKEGRPVAVPGQDFFHVPVSCCSEQGQDQLSRDNPGQNHNLIVKKKVKKSVKNCQKRISLPVLSSHKVTG